MKPSARLFLGIDEAGKGCLVGSMFVAGVLLDEPSLKVLIAAGVKDSKALTPSARERLYDLILRVAKLVVVEEVKPDEIDRVNINELLYDRFARIIRRALESAKGTPLIVKVDSIGKPLKLVSELRRRTGFEGIIVAEYDADAKHVEVAAASIVAKVLRDRHIRSLYRDYGYFGSGYPSDPRTRSWLKEYYMRHGRLPPIVRRSWKTVKDIAPDEYISK